MPLPLRLRSRSCRFAWVSPVAFVLVLGACSHAPAPSPVAPAPAVAPSAPVVSATMALPPGVSVSPPRTGDTTVAFAQSRGGERTFPNNRIGANLAFTSNLRMPRLEAAEVDATRFQLRMRFSNAGKTPLFVSLVCAYDGDAKSARTVRQLEFPVNTFRDIAIDLEGDASRKVNIRATAAEAPAL